MLYNEILLYLKANKIVRVHFNRFIIVKSIIIEII